MSDDKRSTENDSPRENLVSNRDPRSLASETIDWQSTLAACPGPLHAELDGTGSGVKLTISGDDVARRIDLIQHIMQQYQLTTVEAEETVEIAIVLNFLGAMLDYQVVFEFDDESEDQQCSPNNGSPTSHYVNQATHYDVS